MPRQSLLNYKHIKSNNNEEATCKTEHYQRNILLQL